MGLDSDCVPYGPLNGIQNSEHQKLPGSIQS